jgi:photosystem II stability/assembly factor-like uncharacterized protein
VSFGGREGDPGASSDDAPPPSGGGGPSNRQLGYLAVAALVVVVIAVVIIVVASSGSSHTSQSADTKGSGTATVSTPSFTQTVERPTTTSTASVTTSPASGGVAGPGGGPVPQSFQPESFTAVSDVTWWVLGSATCSSPPCTSIVRTVNGGRSFVGIPAPRTDAVSNLRFADARDGYAYGAAQLWSTHDGGATWNRVAVNGDINSLAIAGGHVFVGTSAGLLRSPTGSDSFDQIESADIASVWAQGAEVFVDSQSSSGVPSLLSSDDGGASFQQYAAPQDVVQCSFISTGDGVLWAPCATGMEGSVWRSTDGGAVWDATNPTGGNGGEPNSAPFASASGETAVYGAGQLYRTTDGGRAWSAVSGFPGADETVTYLGFTDPTHGVAIVDDDSTQDSSSALYYTDNGGVSYRPVTITAG